MAVIYCLLTLVLMAVLTPRLVDPIGMLLMRAEWLALTVALIALSYLLDKYLSTSNISTKQRNNESSFHRFIVSLFHCFNLSTFLRVLGQLAWLAKWYPDTYEFNRSFPNLDHLFAQAELSIFGCQPALEFSRLLPQAFWSEAFNLGYWSYFPMIGVLSIAIFILEVKANALAPKGSSTMEVLPTFHLVSTTIIIAFFLYYVIYIFLPVTGPQFYFQAVGVEAIEAGHFPALGTYFSSHTEMLTAPGYADGLFYQLVESAHEAGERPTAAFPSSHIGISTLVLMLSRRHAPQVTKFLLPFWALLCCATVYIQAHYVIDAIAGLLSAPLALWISTWLAHKIIDVKRPLSPA